MVPTLLLGLALGLGLLAVTLATRRRADRARERAFWNRLVARTGERAREPVAK